MYSPNIYTCTIQAQFFILCIILCLQGVKFIPDNQFNFLWIVDFPLFLPAESGGMCTNSVQYVICASLYMYMICACMDYMHSEVHPMCLALCNKLSFENKNDNKFKDKIFIYLLFIEKYHEIFFILNARMVIKS